MEFVKKNPRIVILTGKACSGKNMVARIIMDYYNKRGFKAVDIAYASYLKEYAKKVLGWDGMEDSKPRDFLQDVGVDLIKKEIDEFFLINRVKQDVLVYSYFFDVIIITDARFKEEIDEIKGISDNVVVINIVRDKSNLSKRQMEHITENALNGYDGYDYVIKNDVDDLKKQVIDILEVI